MVGKVWRAEDVPYEQPTRTPLGLAGAFWASTSAYLLWALLQPLGPNDSAEPVVYGLLAFVAGLILFAVVFVWRPVRVRRGSIEVFEGSLVINGRSRLKGPATGVAVTRKDTLYR